MEPFLEAFQELHSPAAADPVHFLLPRKEGGSARRGAGYGDGGDGQHPERLPPPGRATGPSCGAAPSSLSPPGQLLSVPPGRPALAEERDTVAQGLTAKEEGCRKPREAG